MRVLFAGSPSIAVPSLVRIASAHEVVGVLTNPESSKGRGREIQPTQVAKAAMEIFGPAVPILAPERLGTEIRETIARLEPHILVSFAYGKIFGPKFLALFPKSGINIHPSLLPRHRGSSPIQQAILERDAETGVSVQRLALEMDSGDILAMERIALSGDETTESLSSFCGEIGAKLVESVLERVADGSETAIPQAGEPTYCRKISKEDGLIDWTMSCLDIDARVRAFNPWPGCYTFLRGQRLNILKCKPYPDTMPDGRCTRLLNEETNRSGEASNPMTKALPGTILAVDRQRGILVRSKDGVVALETLQFATRKVLTWKEFRNGAGDIEGLVLTSQ
jgi:methionyl-tRNA formyltransferase